MRLSSLFRVAIFTLTGLLLLMSGARTDAQVTTADIVGTVTDPSGAALPNAQVTATNVLTNESRTAQTNANGDYSVVALPVGTYSVTVQATGFKKFSASSIALATGDRARVDAKMEVGEVTQTVEVKESAAPALQTDSSTVGGLVTEQATQDLPLNGRNFMKLAQIVPGANQGSPSSITSGTRADDRRQSNEVSVNGQSDSVNNKMIDGLDDNERAIGTIGVQPSIDAIQEVRVLTNLYTADIGRTAGAVVNIITKSGTNSFHGSAFEFLRNDIFDARNYFDPATIGPKPEYRQNQFGGSLGGPIKRDKTFFFGDYEGLRIVQALTVPTAIVPTACELGRAACNGVTQLGNFSDLSTQIYDPSNGAPFAGNIIPIGRINGVSKNYAALFPSPNLAAAPGAANYAANPIMTQFATTFDARVDHRFNDQNYISGRYTFNNVNTLTPGDFPAVSVAGLNIQPGGDLSGTINQLAGTSTERAQNAAASFTHTFSPNLLLQLNAAYLRIAIISNPVDYGTNASQALGLTGINVNQSASGLSWVNFNGNVYNPLGSEQFLPIHYFDNTTQYSSSLNWTTGNHSVKFGVALIRRAFTAFQSQFPMGQFIFDRTQTANAGGSGGNAFASFLLGTQFSSSRILSLVSPGYRTWEPSAYVQDDWRARPWLTLNLGLRYDIFTPWTEVRDRISNFNPANGAIIVAGQSGSRTAGVTTDYGDVSPRIGFAATIGHGMVVRGGAGLSFFPPQTGSQYQLKNPPFTSNFAGQAGQIWTNPLPAAVANSATNPAGVITGIALDLRNSYVYQTNLLIEKEFGGNVARIGYVGEFGHHLPVNPDIDQLNTPGPEAAGTKLLTAPNVNQPYFSADPNVTHVIDEETIGKSHYNALQASFDRRLRAGLTASANYTYAHEIDNTPALNQGVECAVGLHCIVDAVSSTYTVNGLQYDEGNGTIDIRHRVAVAANYDLPFGKTATGAERQFIAGWQVNGVATWQSGLPFSVTEATPISQTTLPGNNNLGGSRPNVVANLVPANPSVGQWFNVNAFQLQRIGTLGDEGRNQLFGPPQRRFDLSLFKDFHIWESVSLQFRTEVFNLFNTPNFSVPNSSLSQVAAAGTPSGFAPNLNAGNFGKITSTAADANPRQIQFALKLLF